MRIYTSEAAKSLVSLIGVEYRMAEARVRKGFIKPDRMLGTLYERLNRLACDNQDLRKFLDRQRHIPVTEDEDMDLEWARDPREDEPYDDGKPAPRYGTSRDGSNKLTSQSHRDSKS